MLKRFLPSKDEFFTLFQQSVESLNLVANEFHLLLSDVKNQQQYVTSIAKYEHEGDILAHKTFKLLYKTFITPFDRHDIHQLVSRLDDIMDVIHRCAQRFPYYHLQTVPPQAIELARLAVLCAQHLQTAINKLHNLQKAQKILRACEEIDLVENQAHLILLEGEKNLFAEETDFKQFYIMKEIYDRTKDIINKCQDVANIIKGIVLEYS